MRKALVKIDGFDGTPVEIEVRAPSVRARDAIFRNAYMLAVAATATPRRVPEMLLMFLEIEAVLRLSCVPGTNEHVFEEADRMHLLDACPGGFVDQLADVALPMVLSTRRAALMLASAMRAARREADRRSRGRRVALKRTDGTRSKR